MTGPAMDNRNTNRGADIGAGCGLVLLELCFLVVIFGKWILSGWSFDPASETETDSLWGYLPWVGGVGVLAFVAAALAAKAKAIVTVISQGLMATLVAVLVLGGVTAQSRDDDRDRPAPRQPDVVTGCRSGGDSRECAHTGG